MNTGGSGARVTTALDAMPRPAAPPPQSDRTGVVITTHGMFGAISRMCVMSFIRHLPKPYYVLLVINTSSDPVTAKLEQELGGVPDVEVVRLEKDIGGLTWTWNFGIERCRMRGCGVIMLSNHDLYVDESIAHMVQATRECPRAKLLYFGPVTNNPGPAPCNRSQYGLSPTHKNTHVLKFRGSVVNINGFLMSFPLHVLEANRYDSRQYFDPKYRYAGNETDWFERLRARGGKPILVPRTFVHHYKFASWRRGAPQSKIRVCLYTVNTGGYEAKILCRGNTYHRECDMLYYSDNPATLRKAAAMGWIPMYLLPRSGAVGGGRGTKILQRTVKTQPHLYLPAQYQISIYMDGNMQPNWPSVSTLFRRFQVEKYDLVCWKHPVRTRVVDEAREVVRLKLESQEHVDKILSAQARDRFKDATGLCETGFMIRKHSNIIDFSNSWQRAVEQCVRDQVSFDYMVWKHRARCIRHDIKTRPVRIQPHSGDTRSRTLQ